MTRQSVSFDGVLANRRGLRLERSVMETLEGPSLVVARDGRQRIGPQLFDTQVVVGQFLPQTGP
jgi:hypothetical protein